MKKMAVTMSKTVRDFLKIKTTEESVKAEKMVTYDNIIRKALKEYYGKEFSSFVNGREKK
jgi:hypothetical protein